METIKLPTLLNDSKLDSNPDSLDLESSVLLLPYPTSTFLVNKLISNYHLRMTQLKEYVHVETFVLFSHQMLVVKKCRETF